MVGGYGLDSSFSEQEALEGFSEYGNDPSGSTEHREFLDYLLKKESVPWSQIHTY
jgi:hypothetical protein